MHKFQTRVYYQDTDASGIVYHSNYLKFAERARTEWLLEKGLPNTVLQEKKIGFVIRRANIDYLKPACYEDLITIETQISAIHASYMEVEHTFYRENVKLARITLTVVFIDLTSFKPMRLPEEIKELFMKGEN